MKRKRTLSLEETERLIGAKAGPLPKKYGMFQVVIDLFNGELRLTSKEIADQRMAICDQCEAKDHKLNVCTVCGCLLPAKVKLKKASCPMEKW